MQRTLALLAVISATAMLPAQQKTTPEPNYNQFEKRISGDRQILHAMNRLTFGPRPGDPEVVKKIGLAKWMDLQLHPERIPESEALTQLVEPLVEPTTLQGIVRAPAGGTGQAALVVLDGAVQVIYSMQPQVPLQQLITQQQIMVLRTGSDKEGMEVLNSLPRDKVVQVLASMPAVRPRLLPYLDADLRKKVEAAAPSPVQPGDALAQGKLLRAMKGDRQLEEVLTDFWYNHFNVDASKGITRFLLTDYERDAIRPHVLGKFRDLLEATANSAAMMFYLDNWQSSVAPPAGSGSPAQGLNENYGRELMELHTLGVDGGYTQKDIVEVARCFTGWTLDNPPKQAAGFVLISGGRNGPVPGSKFLYNDEMHDKGQKVVLGVTIRAGGGKEDGEKVLDILSGHPSTARFISKELAQRFVADDPPPALVSRMAETFQGTGGDIRAVLATMFNSPEFFSEGAYRSKLKTPLEMVVSAARATGAVVENAEPLVKEIATLGEPLYRKLEPTGYSNRSSDWISSASLLERMNFSLQLAQSLIEGTTVDSEKLPEDPSTLAHQLLSTDLDKQTLDAIAQGLHDHADEARESRRGLIAGMVMGSPDFQRR
jgi:uncharacterized protein (DUF1800 family)